MGRTVRLAVLLERPNDLRPWWLALALAIYGGFSSPTPDDPGWAEAAIGVLLVLAIGLGRGVAVASGALLARPDASLLMAAGSLALVWLLWVPLVRGAAAGWDPEAILRDLIPLLYLFLPLFLADPGRGDPDRPDGAGGSRDRTIAALCLGLALAGVLFAGRFFVISATLVHTIRPNAAFDGLLYLPNGPVVLFAAILLPLTALEWLGRAPHPLRWLGALAMLGGGGLCLAALAVTVQRAALATAALAFLLHFVRSLRRGPALALGGPALAAVVVWSLGDVLLGVINLLIVKTQVLAFNRHDDEIHTAADIAGRSLDAVLIGAGWGSLFEIPAVPGMYVSYFHALPLYFLVKAGLIGLVLALTYFAGFVPSLIMLMERRFALFLACAAPLSIGALIQPSFKYLDYGLMLCLVVLAAKPRKALRRQ